MDGVPTVTFSVLGPVRAFRDTKRLDVGGPKQRLILALLLVRFGATVSTDSLVESLWGDSSPRSARRSIHVYISNLRKAGIPIETESGGYVLRSGNRDSDQFEKAVADARSVTDLVRKASLLADALALWHGPAYADVDATASLSGESLRLNDLRTAVIEDRVQADLESGASQSLIGELESLTREFPFRERFHGQLMLALYRAGRQAEALRAYQRARSILGGELGIEPGNELRQLEDQILRQDPSLTVDRTYETALRSIRGYEIRHPLAEVVGSITFAAFDRAAASEVLITVLDHQGESEAGVGEFEPTARRVAGLSHPNILPLIDFWREPGRSCLVYSRPARLQIGVLESSEIDAAMSAFEDICRGVGFAHRQEVVHGELRPEAVAKLDDGYLVWGFSTGSVSLSDFSAPETRSGQPPSRASDIFSLGRLGERLFADGGSEVASVLARATSYEPANRQTRVEDLLRDIRRATGTDVTGIGSAESAHLPNPYKGLRAFQESDAHDFFGRSSVVDRLLQVTAATSLTAVVGPSGVGKSSVVNAGLIPAIRASGGRPRLIAQIYPGTFPFEELAAALNSIASSETTADLLAQLTADAHGLSRVVKQILPGDETELILVVDQFEELFSLVTDEHARSLFLEALADLCEDSTSRTRLVLTLRADFLERPLEHSTFGPLLQGGLVALSTPRRDDLARAVSQPAYNAGIEFEDGLVAEIVADVADQPGGLPLMQYALTDLANDRTSDFISIESYRESGGVAGALSRRAEGIFTSLTDSGRAGVRQALLRMVTVTEEGDRTRRRVRQSELASLDVDQTSLSRAIRQFGAARLLSFDRDPISRGPTVEIAHEALMRDWERLHGWIERHRENIVLRRRLRLAMAEWELNHHDDDYLLTGGRLDQFVEWAATDESQLASDEARFVERSRQVAEASLAKRRRRRAILTSVVSGLAVAAAMIGWFAFNQIRNARIEEIAGIGRQAQADVADDPEAAMLVALAAADLAAAEGVDVPKPVIAALHESLGEVRVTRTQPGGGPIASSPNGAYYAWIGPDSGQWVLEIRNSEDDAVLHRVTGLGSVANGNGDQVPPGSLAWDSSGRRVAYLSAAGVLRVWDESTFEEVVNPDTLAPPVGTDLSDQVSVAFFSDGSVSYVAAGREDRPSYVLVDLATGSPLPPFVLPDEEQNGISALASSPDGSRLAIGTTKGATYIMDSAEADLDAQSVIVLDSPDPDRVADLAWAGDERLAIISGIGIPLWRVPRAPEESAAIEFAVVHPGTFATSIAASSEFLATGGEDGSVKSYFLDRPPNETQDWVTLEGHDGSITDVAFDESGNLITSSIEDGTVRHWDLSLTGSGELPTLALDSWGYLSLMEFSPDGTLLAANDSNGYVAANGEPLLRSSLAIWDTETWKVVARLPAAPFGGLAQFSPDGRYLAVQNAVDGQELIASTLLDPRLSEVPTVTDIYELPAMNLVATAVGRGAHTHLMAFSPDSSVLASADMDGVLRLWRSDNGDLIDSVDTGSGVFGGVDFSPDGTEIARGNDDGTVNLYGTESLNLIDTIGHEGSPVWDVQYVAEGRRMLVAEMDGTVELWDREKDTTIYVFAGHRAVPWGMTVDQAAGIAATSSLDGTVRLWDLNTGTEVAVLDNAVLPVGTAFHPVKRYLAISDATRGTLLRYEMDPEALIQIARSRATRQLTAQECKLYQIDPCPGSN